MELVEADYLAHFGILRKSGRYPWGSGNNPLQRSKSFLDILEGHKKDGLSEAQVADLYQPKDADGNKIPPYFSVADLRAVKSRSVNTVKREQIFTAQKLQDKGMSPSAIGRQMGVNESTVRSLLEPGRIDKLDILQKTADMLKRQVEEKGMIDVGAHVERSLPIGDDPATLSGISRDKLNTALSLLKEEGYQIHTLKQMQQGTGEMTTRRVLIKADPKLTFDQNQKAAWMNRHNIQLISEKSTDGGRSYQDLVFRPPLTIDPKRVSVKYNEDGGGKADGVIYVRPGVSDVALGKSQYAQVRVAVGKTHFLKGMAIYKDDLPPGVDIQFNTNKSNSGNKLDAMKEMKKGPDGKVDWSNPFGAFPKLGGQMLDNDGNVTSVMNRLNEEGDWNTWSRNLSSQVLSKQSPDLAKAQLDLTYDRRRQEFEILKSLTNPLIKKKLLESFSDETDSAAVHLKAAAMPHQATKVLLPVNSVKPTEVFAPTFPDGTRVALVRFPHAGTFEIPELTVNNRNREARALFAFGKGGTAPDAIGIHPKVAQKLSGADFDGDTVVVIPNNRGSIQSRPALEGLKGFDPQQYKVPTPEQDPVNGWKTVPKDSTKQKQMGKITNLISDMTIKGAKDDEIAAAVRHSMVVIDSEKHNLDYKLSERENGILALKKRYQGVSEKTSQAKGAATLITRATSDERVLKRKDARSEPGLTRVSNATIDNATGKKVYELTGELNQYGQPKRMRSKKLAETEDAFSLVSDRGGTPIEKLYASHSNKLKSLANESRKELVVTKPQKKQPSAAKVYSTEVASLNGKVDIALKNAPLERRAQSVADQIVSQKRRDNPDMDASEKKKIRGQALEEARQRTGAKKHRIEINDKEWEAIQAGAISINKMSDILNNTDIDKLKERAVPRDKPVMNTTMTNRARAMMNSGATPSEIADALGISVSTLQSSLGSG